VVLAVLGAAVPLLVVLVGLALPLVTDELEGDTSVSAPVPLIGLPDQPPPGPVPGVSLSPGEPVSVAIKNPTPRQYNLALLTHIPDRAVYLAFFVLLLRLMRSVRRLDPFTASAARQLRFLGGFLVVGALCASLADMVIGAQLTATVTVDPTYPYYDWDFPFYALISGFGLVVIAEVLRRGAVLREDLEDTS